MTGAETLGLRQKLRARQRQLVVNIDFTSPSLVQALARDCADVIFVDCEQGDTSIGSIPDLRRAAHVEATPLLVRLPDPGAASIERYLFRGIDGIVVPRLDRPAQAEAVIEAVNYSMGARADTVAIVIQIESAAAAGAIDAFLSLARIDAFFVGPVDLSRSMGHGGDISHPEVARQIDRLIRRITSAGRCAGMLCTQGTIAANEARGVSFLYLHTMDFLRHGIAPFAAIQTKDQAK
ncbi:aldolase/citrate lyase family protein [Stappia sp.]|uniref:aldolase/citrate lyase family protein n=1 Tax=Stappia sp. TaxID=1870903 RepID=UPI003A99123C